jgi:N-acetylmuramic acid 6-phosphate (MurNAc-6-P) etherase
LKTAASPVVPDPLVIATADSARFTVTAKAAELPNTLVTKPETPVTVIPGSDSMSDQPEAAEDEKKAGGKDAHWTMAGAPPEKEIVNVAEAMVSVLVVWGNARS